MLSFIFFEIWYNQNMEDKKNNKKLLILGIVTILLFVVGASYAYFAVSTTNNFGTHTISGTMEDVGSVALTSTNNNISINLTAADMMQGSSDIYYYGSTDGTPLTNSDWPAPLIKLADAIVTGSGYYDCNYTVSITASGTNNMYTAFQGMNGKSAGQIGFGIGDYIYGYTGGSQGEGTRVDFNTANLFPVTYNGVINGISSSKPGAIYGALAVANKSNVDQTALAGTDITMTATVTSFTCAVSEPYLRNNTIASTTKYWNSNYNSTKYDDNTTLVNNNYNYYIKEKTSSLTQTIANKPFYLSVYNTSYSELDRCLNNSINPLTEPYICVLKNGYYYRVFTDTQGEPIFYNSYMECNIYGGNVCEGYNINEVFSEDSGTISYETCGVVNGTEVCIKPNDWSNAATYKSTFESAGATCSYIDNNIALECLFGNEYCTIDNIGSATCGKVNYSQYRRYYCSISNTTHECASYSIGGVVN